MNQILLDILAFAAVFSAVLVITAKNPVLSVLFLISVFINVAGYLVLMGVAYLGLAYLIIYVGAIAILFLFVIMMLNLRLVELIDTGQEYTKNLPLGIIIGSLFFFELFSILPNLLKYSYKDLIAFTNLFIREKESYSLFNLMNDFFLLNNEINFAFSPVIADYKFNTFLQIESIGQGLYTYAALWLIIASVIFLLAMVGPIVLCLKQK